MSQFVPPVNYFNKLLVMFVLMLASLGCQVDSDVTSEVSSKQPTPNVSTAIDLAADSSPKFASATIFPIYSIAQQIGGDSIEVSLILSSGESPHTFNPTPGDRLDSDKSELMFYIGNGLDEWVTEIANTNTQLVEVGQGIKKINHESSHDDDHDENHESSHDDDHDENHESSHDDDHDDSSIEHHGHDHGPTDPHYWLDPRNGKQIARTIAAQYTLIDPANASSYQENLELFNTEVDELYANLLTQLEVVQNIPFITFHDSWNYFADAFTLNLVSTFQPPGEHQPSPRYLKKLQDKIELEEVRVLFSEPQFPIDTLRSFADDNDLEIGVLDPLGGVDGRMTFQELLSYNANALRSSLLEKQ